MHHHNEISADDALALLRGGNDCFLAECHRAPQSLLKVAILATHGQFPFAIIVTCSDSRVSPEIVFHCGLGDLFVVRTAGHALDEAVLGSIEYAADHLGTKLIVVLGHSKCGAVAGACEEDGHAEGALASLINSIRPCVEQAKTRTADPGMIASIAEDLNIAQVVEALKNNDVLKKIADLKIIGAKYDIETGEVEFR